MGAVEKDRGALENSSLGRSSNGAVKRISFLDFVDEKGYTSTYDILPFQVYKIKNNM